MCRWLGWGGVGVGLWKGLGMEQGGGSMESTARVWGREGAVCGHLDPRIGTQHLLPVPTLLSPAVSQSEAHLNLSPEVLSPQLWEPADLDSWEACGETQLWPWEATLLKGWGHLVRSPCMASTRYGGGFHTGVTPTRSLT